VLDPLDQVHDLAGGILLEVQRLDRRVELNGLVVPCSVPPA